MANSQTKATAEYRKRQGIISKNFKLKRKLCEQFAEACKTANVSQTEAVKAFMEEFIRNHPAEAKQE